MAPPQIVFKKGLAYVLEINNQGEYSLARYKYRIN
jgi:hypothetical protein